MKTESSMSHRCIIVAVTAIDLLCPVASTMTGTPVTQISLNPKATYLHLASSDSGLAAVAIDLAALDCHPGDQVRLERLGQFDNGPQAEIFVSLLGVFSSSNVLLAPANFNRVPGAIDAGVDINTACSYYGCEATNIPQDFAIGASDGSFTSVCLTIPAGAAYLFVGPHDSLFEDNTDPAPDYALRIMRRDCPADIAPKAIGGDGTVNVSDLLAVISAWGGAGSMSDIAPPCGNGTVNVEDLLAVIGHWGACP